jgi:hypothetical protein
MQARIEQELGLLRRHFPNLEYLEEGHWIKIPSYSMPPGWNKVAVDVIFQVAIGYPGTPPYGFYVGAGLRFKGQGLNNYTEPAGKQPPFEGTWGFFSWAPADGEWRATADLSSGCNLLNWVLGFSARFNEGI